MGEHVCQICDFSTSISDSLRRHVSCKHLKIKTHKCQQCGTTFSRKCDLDAHTTSVHVNKKELQCMICMKTFNLATYLHQHVKRIHNKIKNHMCPMCEARFVTNQDLTRHVKVYHVPWNACLFIEQKISCIYCNHTKSESPLKTDRYRLCDLFSVARDSQVATGLHNLGPTYLRDSVQLHLWKKPHSSHKKNLLPQQM